MYPKSLMLDSNIKLAGDSFSWWGGLNKSYRLFNAYKSMQGLSPQDIIELNNYLDYAQKANEARSAYSDYKEKSARAKARNKKKQGKAN